MKKKKQKILFHSDVRMTKWFKRNSKALKKLGSLVKFND